MTHLEQIQSYIKAYNAFDVEGMIRDLHPDVVFENINGEEVNLRTEGVVAFKDQATKALDYFSERKQRVSSWHVKNNTITVDIDYKAKLAVDLSPEMKKGDTLEINGQSEFEFDGDKIIKITDRS